MSMPYRLETPRLVIRCYQPGDAPLLKAAVDASLDHLRPWMPWAVHEPTDLAAKVQRLRLMRGEFDLDRDYAFGIFDRGETRLLGSTGLHTRLGPEALEIGYWIHAAETGRGYAAEASAALTQIAFAQLGKQRVEIRCDPANTASLAIPRKLGYRHVETLSGRDSRPDGSPRDTMIWALTAAEYAAEPFARVPLRSFDACGASLGSRA